MGNYFFTWVISWVPLLFSLGIVVTIIYRHIFWDKKMFGPTRLTPPNYKKLIFLFFVFSILYSSFLTGLQYYVWHSSPIGRFFFPPYQPLNYFITYSYRHFWLPSLLSLIGATIFYGVLLLMRQYKKESISKDEALFVFLASLLVAWPKFIIFVPMFFLFTFLSLIFRQLFLKKDRVVIFWPLIVSILFSWLLGNSIIYFFNLPV